MLYPGGVRGAALGLGFLVLTGCCDSPSAAPEVSGPERSKHRHGRDTFTYADWSIATFQDVESTAVGGCVRSIAVDYERQELVYELLLRCNARQKLRVPLQQARLLCQGADLAQGEAVRKQDQIVWVPGGGVSAPIKIRFTLPQMQKQTAHLRFSDLRNLDGATEVPLEGTFTMEVPVPGAAPEGPTVPTR